MAKIDELIRKAQDALNSAKDDDKPVAQAKLDALKDVKAAKIEMDNDEVNGLVTRKQGDAEKKWKDLVGMDHEEAKKLFEQMDDDTVKALLNPGDGDGDDDKPVMERVQSLLQARDTSINELKTSLSDVNGRYSKDKVDVAVERAFEAAGLDKKFLAPAKNLAAYDDLVEKVKKGQPITHEEIQGKVDSVKTLSDVWFKAEGDGGDEEDGKTVAGHRIREEAVGPVIPATPQAGGPVQITEEDRANRATSVY